MQWSTCAPAQLPIATAWPVFDLHLRRTRSHSLSSRLAINFQQRLRHFVVKPDSSKGDQYSRLKTRAIVVPLPAVYRVQTRAPSIPSEMNSPSFVLQLWHGVPAQE